MLVKPAVAQPGFYEVKSFEKSFENGAYNAHSGQPKEFAEWGQATSTSMTEVLG